MKKFLLGTAILIIAGFLSMILSNNAFKDIIVPVCVTLAVIGFLIQMISAFSLRSKVNKEIRQSQKNHEELLARIKDLPPDEAIRILLKQ